MAVHTYSVGAISPTSARALSSSLVLVLVKRNPFLVLIMCPSAVTVNGGRCFVINVRVRPGNVESSSGCLVRTLMSAETGGDPIDWW